MSRPLKFPIGTIRKFGNMPATKVAPKNYVDKADGWFTTRELIDMLQGNNQVLHMLLKVGVLVETVLVSPRYRRFWKVSPSIKKEFMFASARRRLVSWSEWVSPDSMDEENNGQVTAR